MYEVICFSLAYQFNKDLGRGKKFKRKKFDSPKKSNFFPPSFFFSSYGSKGATRIADHSF